MVVFAGIALKHEKVSPTFSSFNVFPSLPSLSTLDIKQFQRLNIDFKMKTGLLFWNKIDAKARLGLKIANGVVYRPPVKRRVWLK